MDGEMKVNSLNGLSTINIELSSLCGHRCWCCGRRKIEKEHPELVLQYGNMDFELLKLIEDQVPRNVVCQFHNNGCPLEYPLLDDALKLFERCHRIRCFNTKGGTLLIEKADQIINNMESIIISMIPNDSEWEELFDYLKKFLITKGSKKPLVVLRLTGEIEKERVDLYKELSEKYDCMIATRMLHSPMGSFDYARKVTVPEIGICLDLLHHLSIDRFGNVSCCVRFDPDEFGVIGDANKEPLADIWNGEKRREIIQHHLMGERYKVPLCDTCEFWGVPTSG